MPTTFRDLPVELLQPILAPLPESALVKCARVSKQWHAFAVPLLYRRVTVYSWNTHAKTRAATLVQTLASRPDIARYVKHVELRDFPRDFGFGREEDADRERIYADQARGLANCVNLQTCIWTRHGTLTSAALLSLSRLPHLTRLEINGACGSYEPSDLLSFRRIKSLNLMMPDKATVDVLEDWMRAIQAQGQDGGINNLSFVCQSTPYITSSLLRRLAPYSHRLESLVLVGCAKVDQKGLVPLLQSCSLTIRTLGIESVSAAFDLSALHALSLPRLGTLSITLPSPPAPHRPFLASLAAFTASSPLEALTLSLPATLAPPPTSLVLYNPNTAASFVQAQEYPQLEPDWARLFALQHASSLRKLAISRLPTSLLALETIVGFCSRLETLVVPVHEYNWDRVARAVSAPVLPRLRVLHFTYPTSPMIASLARPEVVSLDNLKLIAQQCSATLQQIGQLNRVYEVSRRWLSDEEGSHIALERWSGPAVAEVFQVIRG